MKDEEKTKEQLLDELIRLRQQLAVSEKSKGVPVALDALRRHSEKRLKGRKPYTNLLRAEEDPLYLLLEVQVHQTELEAMIQELRGALERIEESRAKYRDLYDSTPAGYLTLDGGGRIEEANLTLTRWLGARSVHLTGTHLQRYLSSEEADKLHLHLVKVFKTRKRETCELLLETKDRGSLWMLLESVVIQDSRNGKLCRVSLIDITERKQMEEALQRARDELEQRVADRTQELARINEELSKEVAERKLALKELQTALIKYRTLFDPSPSVLWFQTKRVASSNATERQRGFWDSRPMSNSIE